MKKRRHQRSVGRNRQRLAALDVGNQLVEQICSVRQCQPLEEQLVKLLFGTTDTRHAASGRLSPGRRLRITVTNGRSGHGVRVVALSCPGTDTCTVAATEPRNRKAGFILDRVRYFERQRHASSS